nr:MAG TPA: hypothetical protein [Caudoviricetes sp.]
MPPFCPFSPAHTLKLLAKNEKIIFCYNRNLKKCPIERKQTSITASLLSITQTKLVHCPHTQHISN